jgi:hypothetical protein
VGTTFSRIRLVVLAFGFGLLSVSLFDWSQNLNATKHGYLGVEARASSASAVETFEIWGATASCTQPIPNAQDDFEHYVLYPPGFGGLPADLNSAPAADCVRITPIKKIRAHANYFAEIWRWPVDHIAAFSFGLELILIGALFVPISLWIATGDLQAVMLSIRVERKRLRMMVRRLHRRNVCVLSSVFRAIRHRMLILSNGSMTSGFLHQPDVDGLLPAPRRSFTSKSNDITNMGAGSEKFIPKWCSSPRVPLPVQVSL